MKTILRIKKYSRYFMVLVNKALYCLACELDELLLGLLEKSKIIYLLFSLLPLGKAVFSK